MRNSPSCRTRSSFFCISALMSPISSRNSVPPSACSSRPFLVRCAPVKAPRACPKSSLSSSVSGSAAQFSLTKGWVLRGLLKWIARAISSLPVPLSPSIRTGRSLTMMRSSWWKTRRMPSLAPTMAL